jgi:abhydrolase domain-containing protein 6
LAIVRELGLSIDIQGGIEMNISIKGIISSFLFVLARRIERGSAGLSEKSIQVDHHKIVYLEGGKGETVLLLHGFGGDKDNWTRFSKYLTKRYHVIALDLPGFGESSRIWSDTYDIAAQVKRVHQYTEKMGLKKLHIAGNSMGGLIAGIFTATYPDEVLSLALLDPIGVIAREPSQLALEVEKGNNPLIVESVSDYNKLLGFLFVKPPYIPGPVKSYLTEMAIQSRDFNKKVFIEANPGNQLEAIAGEIRVKTLILWGDTDRVVPSSSAAVLQRGIENSKAILMKDCGHVPMLERPNETAQHYLEFISLNKINY